MNRFIVPLFALLLVAACTENGSNPGVEANAKDSVSDLLEKLDSIDADLLADETMNKEKGWRAFIAFRGFARKFPDNALAPTYHMKAAAIARNIPGKALMAIEEYTDVYKKYPMDTLAPQAQFLVGFTFDQALNDGPRARKAYVKFIEDWPQHPLAVQARDLIAIIDNDQSDLEQVKAWEKNTQK